jgi:hypothetical protein
VFGSWGQGVGGWGLQGTILQWRPLELIGKEK